MAPTDVAVQEQQASANRQRVVNDFSIQVRRLAAGPVDGGDLNAEIVDDPLSIGGRLLLLNRYVCRCHSEVLENDGIRGEDPKNYSISRIAFPMSAGLLTTVTPAAVRAAIFSAAVPLPP